MAKAVPVHLEEVPTPPEVEVAEAVPAVEVAKDKSYKLPDGTIRTDN